MLVSIVINNYNYGHFIKDAIESVLAQTHKPIELIVVDDGSTDNSREVIRSYGDKLISVFKENGGQASAANEGWKLAKGEIVMFLDSDDVYLPDTVEKCVQKFSSGDVNKVQFLLRRVNQDLQPIGGTMPTYGLSHEDVRKDIWRWGFYLCTPGSGNAYSQSFLKEVMPAPLRRDAIGHDLAPDGYLCSLAGITGKVVSIIEELGLYRVHGKNISLVTEGESVKKLRNIFMIDYMREQEQIAYARKIGIEPPKSDLSRFHPNVCKGRFLAFRLSPEDHPIPTDTYWGLLISGIRGAVTFPYLKTSKRLSIIVGFVLIALIPKPMLPRFTQIINAADKKAALFNLIKSLKGAA